MFSWAYSYTPLHADYLIRLCTKSLAHWMGEGT